jgi:hypothetical protein
MADVTLVDLVKITASTTGTGAVTLGSPVPGYRGVEALLDGAVYSYSIQQEFEYEVGTGTFLEAGRQFVRSPTLSSDGGTAINLQPNATIAFVATAQDILGRDVLRPLYGYGQPFNDTGVVGQTYTDLNEPVKLYGPKTSTGWGVGITLSGGEGATGPADNTYTTYTALLASDGARKSARLVPEAGETEPPGNFAYINGVWVRQAASGITAMLPDGTNASLQRVASSQPLYASLLGFTGAATVSGYSEIGRFVMQIVALGRPGVWDLPLVLIDRPEVWPDNVRLAIRAGCELRSRVGLSPQDQGDAVISLGNNTSISGESTGDWVASSYDMMGTRVDDYHRWLFKASSKIGVTLKQCRALSIKMFLSDAGSNTYAQVVVGTNTSSNILVEGGSVDFLTRPAGKSSGSVAFFYTIGATARNIRMDRVPNGAQANGGDASTGGNGAVGNQRKCDRIRFENIDVHDSADTWVFFGMVANGEAVGCTGDGAQDVGFDREGCGDATGDGVFWYNCRGNNAVNGIFSNFWLNRGGAIINCSLHQPNASQPLVAMVNPTLDIANRDFVMRGCDLSTDGGIGLVALDTAVGNIMIEGCRSRNVRWRVSGNNHFGGGMANTDVNFDYVSSTQITAVEVGQFHQNSGMDASFKVSNVKIKSPLQGGASIGIGVSTDDPNGDPTMIVENCKIEGFTTDIMFDNRAAASTGHKGIFMALRNTLKNKQIVSINTAGVGVFVADGNRGFDGAAI